MTKLNPDDFFNPNGCGSMYDDVHYCDLDNGHNGPHRCVSYTCPDVTWIDVK